jgi:hypothetical protein
MEMKAQKNIPNIERLSLITATILIAYTTARLVAIPSKTFQVQLPGLFISGTINLRIIVAFLVAAITATGANQLVSDHPSLNRKRPLQHWLLPALTALVIGIPFYQIPLSLYWWIGFFVGGTLLITVLVAEYFVVDPNDIYYAPASITLTAVSFAIFMVLVASLKFSHARLLFTLPIASLGAGLVSLRALNLRLNGRWYFSASLIVMLVIGQITAAIHYWSISPIGFSLFLLGAAYALTSFIGNLSEKETVGQALLDPLVVLVLIWVAALWVW